MMKRLKLRYTNNNIGIMWSNGVFGSLIKRNLRDWISITYIKIKMLKSKRNVNYWNMLILKKIICTSNKIKEVIVLYWLSNETDTKTERDKRNDYVKWM